jgi:Reverse transcriptase (RNA-dependent DNA polymerase)
LNAELDVRRTREERAAHRNLIRDGIERETGEVEIAEVGQDNVQMDHQGELERNNDVSSHAGISPEQCNAVSPPLEVPAGLKESSVTVPKSYYEAKRSLQWPFWEHAMCEEKDSLDANNTMEYVTRPMGKKVIPVHWVYALKTDPQGNVVRFKARLVAQGCKQISGIDVGEVFAPVSSYGA